jgi:hypothetical protein
MYMCMVLYLYYVRVCGVVCTMIYILHTYGGMYVYLLGGGIGKYLLGGVVMR